MSNLDAKFRLKDNNGKGLSKNDFTDIQKSKIDNNPVDTNDVLYNGSTTSANAIFINEGGTYAWTSGNASIVVPVVAGRTIRIQGRDLSPLSKTNVWLTSNVQTVGSIPAFLTGAFSTSAFYNDRDIVVPEGATHLYILFFSNVTASVKIIDLTSSILSSFLIKPTSLPNDLFAKAMTLYSSSVAVAQRTISVLAKNSYVAVNKDVNFYFDSQLTLPDRSNSYFLTAQSSDASIKRINRGIRYNPTGSASDISVNYTLRDNTNQQVSSFTKVIKTVNKTGTGTKKILNLGDSYIETGIIPWGIGKSLESVGYAVNHIGTVDTLYAPSVIKCEGRSGWTASNYANDNAPTVNGVTRTNPFRKNNALDFTSYITDNSLSVPDIVVLHLGINDVGGFASEVANSTIDTASSNIGKLLTAMLSAWTSCKIIVCLPHLGAIQFNTAVNVQDFRTVNIAKMAKKIVDVYDEFRYNARVYVSDASQSIDRIEGHSYTSINPSSRISGLTERQYGDPVHPSASGTTLANGQGGYWQMVDSLFGAVLFVA